MMTTSLSATAKVMPGTMVDATPDDRKRRKTDVPGLPKLQKLIAAHRIALAELDKAIDAKNDTELAYEKAYPEEIIIPNLMGGGVTMTANRDHCEKQMEDLYTYKRQSLKGLDRIDPKLYEKALSSLGKLLRQNMALLSEHYAAEAVREEKFGLSSVNRKYDAVCDRERSTLAAICSYRCQSVEEFRVRGYYIANTPDAREGMDTDMVELLLDSMAEA